MVESIYLLLTGSLTLALNLAATASLVRKQDSAAFLLIAAGLSGTAFFAAVPNLDTYGVILSLCVTVTGIVIAPDQPAASSADWADETGSGRSRRQ